MAPGIDRARRRAHHAALPRGPLGPYQLQAAIQAVHSEPPTDWRQVVALYDHLLALTPTPVVALNRAVAVAEVHGPALALAAIEDIDLPGYHLLPATRAELLRRLGRHDEARAAYAQALELAPTEAERRFLARRLKG